MVQLETRKPDYRYSLAMKLDVLHFKGCVFWLHHHDVENTAYKNCLLPSVLWIIKRVFVKTRWGADFFSIQMGEGEEEV